MMVQPITTSNGGDGKSQWDRTLWCLRFFRNLRRKYAAATSLLLIQAPTTAKDQCILHISHDDESNHEEQPLLLSSDECIILNVNHELNEEVHPCSLDFHGGDGSRGWLFSKSFPPPSSPAQGSNGVEDKRDVVISYYDLTRDEVSQMVKRKDLKLLKRSGGLPKVASLFNSDLEQGINIGDQHVVGHDPSKPSIINQVYFFHFLLGACKNYTLFFLAVAAALTTATDIMGEGLVNSWHTGPPVIMAMFLIVIGTSVKNFVRAKKLEKELRKERNSPVLVRRGGTDHFAARSEVVEGDVVMIKKDDMIPGDGLLIDGNNLVLDEVLNPGINSHLNPFLFFGSKVVSGSGSMLIITTRIIDTNPHPNYYSTPLPEDLLNRANNYIERLALSLSLCIIIAVFTRALLLLLNHHHQKNLHGDKPELKRDVSVKQLMNLLNKLMLSRQGVIPVLMRSLAVMVIGLQHGVPLVVSLNLSYWNSKAQAQMQTLSACATMGLATVLYVDITCEDMEVLRYVVSDQTKEDIRVLQDSGLKIKLASELDEPYTLKSKAREFGIDEDEEDDVSGRKGEENQNNVIIRKLKESGEVVAFYGGSSTSIYALREADLGITEMSRSTQMAKANSDIILMEKGIHPLVRILKFGRSAMANAKFFMQLQLISCISWLLVSLVMTVSSGDSPWTPVHQIWVNLVMFIVGAPMMRMPLKAKKLFA